MQLDDQLKEALIKKATGYTVKESVMEYGVEEGEEKLLKKKVSTKYYPPDLSAINILLNEKQVDIQSLTDDELELEKEKIIKLLKELDNGNKKD
ncbi:MAG: hypothetical protein MR288_01985 [Firmicutes bacterium]|nr:hypothetical protein [Bacillota bacterium]